jgi:hypothetical protein
MKSLIDDDILQAYELSKQLRYYARATIYDNEQDKMVQNKIIT